jgi:hypothetical protein
MKKSVIILTFAALLFHAALPAQIKQFQIKPKALDAN